MEAVIGNKKLKNWHMLSFYNKENNAVLITSYKVMFWTLKHQKSLHFGAPPNFILANILSRQPWEVRRYYLLVRNPYTRLESFFKDKFRKNISRREKKEEWQNCQRIFFGYLGVNDETNFEVTKRKFLDTSFEDFIDLLPNVYHLDGHLWPQSLNKKVLTGRWGIKLNYNLNFDRVFKMENPDDLEEMASKLGLDLSTKMNSTAEVNSEIIWTKRSRNIVKSIYGQDFREFNYDFFPRHRYDEIRPSLNATYRLEKNI